ncbi:MAG TPA: hypothetical protein DDY39_09730, partial [Nitrospira sp.]|nr:hypothetical protein [Nitrospira sp.]
LFHVVIAPGQPYRVVRYSTRNHGHPCGVRKKAFVLTRPPLRAETHTSPFKAAANEAANRTLPC